MRNQEPIWIRNDKLNKTKATTVGLWESKYKQDRSLETGFWRIITEQEYNHFSMRCVPDMPGFSPLQPNPNERIRVKGFRKNRKPKTIVQRVRNGNKKDGYPEEMIEKEVKTIPYGVVRRNITPKKKAKSTTRTVMVKNPDLYKTILHVRL